MTQINEINEINQISKFQRSEKREYFEQCVLGPLDSMQTAVIENLGSDRVDCVYCADVPLISILKQEGFMVLNPEML
jgi:hypothetical protein